MYIWFRWRVYDSAIATLLTTKIDEYICMCTYTYMYLHPSLYMCRWFYWKVYDRATATSLQPK